MEHRFHIGGGAKRRWSEAQGAHFVDYPDSLSIVMSTEDALRFAARILKRVLEEPGRKMLPSFGYSGKYINEEEAVEIINREDREEITLPCL